MTAKKTVKMPVTKKTVSQVNSLVERLDKYVEASLTHRFVLQNESREETHNVILIEKDPDGTGYNILVSDAGFDDTEFVEWYYIDPCEYPQLKIVNTLNITTDDLQAIDKIKDYAESLGVKIK